MSLSKRIASLEARAAPILERARKRRQRLEHILNNTQNDFDKSYQLAQYIGNNQSREQAKSDWGEFFLLSLFKCQRLFKPAPRFTREQIREGMAQASVILAREWYGREITLDEAKREQEMIEQAAADLEAGISPDKSEAAMYYRNLFARYPRLKNQSGAMRAYLAGADMQEWHEQDGRRYDRA